MDKGSLPASDNLVLFRADGGPRIGMGHVVRCLTLAGALSLPAAFLSLPDAAVERAVRRAGFDFLALEEPESFPFRVAELQPAVLVVDNYGVSGTELAAVKKTVPLLVVIDDLNDRYLPADILINGNVTAPGLDYAADKLLLLGPEYLLLRDSFRGMPPKEVPAKAHKVLVTAGGGDPCGLTFHTLACLLGLDLHLKVALGSQFTGRTDLESLIGNRSSFPGEPAGTVVELLENPDMACLMIWADLAVSTGGSTLYELCAAGTPGLAIAVAVNQVASAKMLGELGCTCYLGCHTEVFGDQAGGCRGAVDLKEAVQSLAGDPVRRKDMAERGRKLVDGRGAERCADGIRSYRAKLAVGNQ